MAAEPEEIPSEPSPDEPTNRKQRRANAVIKRRTRHKEVVEEIEEPDQFQQQGRTVVDWVLDHIRQLGMVVAGILVILLVWGVLGSLSTRKSQQAAEALYKARRDLPALNAPPSEAAEVDTAALTAGLAALEAMIAEYSGTPQARQARVDAGGIAFRLGQNDKAIELYDGAIKGKSLVANQARAGKAFALEAKGDLAGAATVLEDLRDTLSGDMKAQTTLDLARIYAANGAGDKAKGLLASFEEEFPDSLLLPDAQARLAGLN